MMLGILLFIPGDYAGPCFIGFAIGESLGAAALRIAGGIFTKIADIGSDLMKIVFNIKEDDARNPGVIADCTGDNAGDSVGPTADGFETYGVTGVALISFILLAVHDPKVQVQLLVWIFVMRIMMIVASGLSYLLNERRGRKATYGDAETMNFEQPLTTLVWLTSIVSVAITYVVSLPADPGPRRRVAVVEAFDHHHLRHAGRRDHPGTGEGLHVDELGPRQGSRDVGPRGRGVAEHPVGPGGGQLQRLLAGPGHRGADGHRLPGQHDVPGEHDAGAGGVRVRPGGVRLPRHGAGDDRGRFLRPGDRQRSVGLRAVDDRDAAEHQAGAEEGLRLRRELRPRPRTCSKRTTARATRSRRRPSRC